MRVMRDLLLFCFVFKTGSPYVALVGLELAMQNSQRSASLCFLSARNKSVQYKAQPLYLCFETGFHYLEQAVLKYTMQLKIGLNSILLPQSPEPQDGYTFPLDNSFCVFDLFIFCIFSRVHKALSLMKIMNRVYAQDAGAQNVHAI